MTGQIDARNVCSAIYGYSYPDDATESESEEESDDESSEEDEEDMLAKAIARSKRPA
ncbi:MAG: hypothetical protein WCG04_06610 [Alphaproteobacteria bacterium]